MAKTQSKELAETGSGGAMALPDFMKGSAGQGVNHLGMDDAAIPRIALAQALSEFVSAGAARPGEFYHLLAEQNLGRELKITPIIIQRAYILWRPRDDGGGILARADDGIHWSPANAEFTVKINKGTKQVTWKTAPTVAESGLDQWGSEDPGNPQALPAATKMLNTLLYLHDFPHLSPSVITLQRSSLKAGKNFVGRLKMSTAPAFGHVFTVTSTEVTGPKGKFWTPQFNMTGYIEKQELFQQLKEHFEHFEKVGVRVAADEALRDEGSEADDGTADRLRGEI